ncbi:MAG: hypothetical protein JWP58_4262 [Hymenobacter sp.]|nr:hypothetical protein [Hymenobacter sp.]
MHLLLLACVYSANQLLIAMKGFLLSFALLFGLSARAQTLPVPGGKNPDWVLLKTEKRPYDGRPIIPPGTDRMPNAAQKSISSIGNHHYTWDAEHQLAYDWLSRDSSSVAPFKLVQVREGRKDVMYVYRRAH